MNSLKKSGGGGWGGGGGRGEQTLAPLLACDGPKNVHFCVSKAYSTVKGIVS
jgi:hypothetical protein